VVDLSKMQHRAWVGWGNKAIHCILRQTQGQDVIGRWRCC
jgi:hypothetical protein